jgi:hypothetical protein
MLRYWQDSKLWRKLPGMPRQDPEVVESAYAVKAVEHDAEVITRQLSQRVILLEIMLGGTISAALGAMVPLAWPLLIESFSRMRFPSRLAWVIAFLILALLILKVILANLRRVTAGSRLAVPSGVAHRYDPNGPRSGAEFDSQNERTDLGFTAHLFMEAGLLSWPEAESVTRDLT